MTATSPRRRRMRWWPPGSRWCRKGAASSRPSPCTTICASARCGSPPRATLAERFDYVHGLFPRLSERDRQLAGTLSGGEQQMLAIGRALMSNPRVLLLDEPFLGLAPMIAEEIRGVLRRLAERGLTILLVEQKIDMALDFAQRAYVMVKGRIVLAGTAAEIRERGNLNQIYFALAEPG